VAHLVDAIYIRGWEDCIDVVTSLLEKTESLEEAKKKIKKIQGLVKENKFEKIKYELGAFDILNF